MFINEKLAETVLFLSAEELLPINQGRVLCGPGTIIEAVDKFWGLPEKSWRGMGGKRLYSLTGPRTFSQIASARWQRGSASVYRPWAFGVYHRSG